MPRIRILILTSSTGGGHDARAQSFAEWCFLLYRYEADVRIEQMLEDSSALYRGAVRFYNWIQRQSPWMHKAFFTFVEILSVLNRSTVVFGRAYYERVLREYRPHLVFSVHDCLNRGYFQLARRILGAANVRCATYCGEFTGGWGYSRNWVEPSVDRYFSRTPTANDFAIKLGLPPARAHVRGDIEHPRAYLDVLSPQERRRYRQRELGLHPGLFTVFLATGANGANNHFDLLPELLSYADKAQAIVVCGRNHQTYNEVVHWRSLHPGFNCFVDSYSEVMHLLMQASDVIVTRGGTTTCAKALHFRCPVVLNAIGGIMPQERLTVKFFRRAAGVELVETPAQFRVLMQRWMADCSAYERLRDNFLSLRYEGDPIVMIEELVDLAGEAARVRLTRRSFPSPDGNG